jgi:CBS domain-containing protein
MAEHGVGAVLISAGGQLTGLVTDRDIAVRVLAEDRDPASTAIGDICTAGLFVLGPDDDLDQAARLIRDRAVRRIPIVADGVPVGLVSIGDLALEQDEPAPRRAS